MDIVHDFEMLQMAYRPNCPELQGSFKSCVQCFPLCLCEMWAYWYFLVFSGFYLFAISDVSFWTFSLGKPKIRQSCWVPLKIGHQPDALSFHWTQRSVQYLMWETIHNFHSSSENPRFSELAKQEHMRRLGNYPLISTPRPPSILAKVF